MKEDLFSPYEDLSKMPPLVDPIGRIDFRIGNDRENIKGPRNIINANEGVGTGLKNDPLLIFPVNANAIDTFLKSLDYGAYIKTWYDCDNQAYWGMAHLRHRWPGICCGVASGINDRGEKHAEIMYWLDGVAHPYFWDQNRATTVGDYRKIHSAIAFPWGSLPDTKPPFNGFKPISNPAFFYNEKYLIYPTQFIIDFLKNRKYDNPCQQKRPHQEDHRIYYPTAFDGRGRWTSYDEALWGVVHLRRHFPGCAVGVAKGTTNGGIMPSTVIIWHYPNDDTTKKPEPLYWDSKVNDTVSFNPEKIIY